jgi:guanylate kinase
MAVLESRLRQRANDDEESIRRRLAKASHELTFEQEFDAILINDDLQVTLKEAEDIVQNFLLLG